jgi:hypothetical protein
LARRLEPSRRFAPPLLLFDAIEAFVKAVVKKK